jgi:predicted transcriptional regulator
MNILEKPENQRKSCVLTTARLMLARNKIFNKLLRRCRYHVTAVKRAPFDFVISAPEERMRIIGGIANKKETELDRRVNEIISVSRVTQARPILITEDQQRPEKDILYISSENVSKIKNPKDLIARVR